MKLTSASQRVGDTRLTPGEYIALVLTVNEVKL